MKETEHIETPETDKVVIEQNIQKQIEYIGSQRKIKGLVMYELNPKEMTLEPAVFKEVTPELKGKQLIVRYKLIHNEGCVYVQALNKKNAYKKIAKKYKNFKLKN